MLLPLQLARLLLLRVLPRPVLLLVRLLLLALLQLARLLRPGDFPAADVVITADYQTTLPTARLVYTPEIRAQRAADRAANPSPNVKGDMAKAPPYLVELHNQLAAVTA